MLLSSIAARLTSAAKGEEDSFSSTALVAAGAGAEVAAGGGAEAASGAGAGDGSGAGSGAASGAGAGASAFACCACCSRWAASACCRCMGKGCGVRFFTVRMHQGFFQQLTHAQTILRAATIVEGSKAFVADTCWVPAEQ